jgi:hypothetical protein
MDEMGDVIMFNRTAAEPRNYERSPNDRDLMPVANRIDGIQFVDRATPDIKFRKQLTVRRLDSDPPSLDECIRNLVPSDRLWVYRIRNPVLVNPHKIDGQYVYVLDLYARNT